MEKVKVDDHPDGDDKKPPEDRRILDLHGNPILDLNGNPLIRHYKICRRPDLITLEDGVCAPGGPSSKKVKLDGVDQKMS